MSNLIDRQVAIDALDRIFNECEEIEVHLPKDDPDRTGYKMYPDYITVRKYLCQLPFAQPEREMGEWLCSDDMFEYAICSSCKWDSGEPWEYAKKNFNFCPNCGADMKGEQNGSVQPEIVRCKDCEYGEQDNAGRWFCRSLGCQIGNEDGSGYCADAKRRRVEL